VLARSFLRGNFAVVASALLLLAASTGRAGGERNRGATPLSMDAVLGDAQRLAARSGDRVVRVEGGSMQPYFGDGAILIVRATRAAALRPGMVVVYQNRFGERVAHRIETQTEAGWSARGANNLGADSTPVTDANLVGVVYVTLYPDPRSPGGPVLAEATARGVDVVLAAEAR
jgi:hypothetical protein